MSIEQLRAKTGFKLTPLQVGPNVEAFAAFLSFATGNTPEAKKLKRDFCDRFKSDGLDPSEVAAAFIDWLIANHWGEAPSTVEA